MSDASMERIKTSRCRRYIPVPGRGDLMLEFRRDKEGELQLVTLAWGHLMSWDDLEGGDEAFAWYGDDPPESFSVPGNAVPDLIRVLFRHTEGADESAGL